MIPTHYGVVVLCDANVLYKGLLRDLIMRLGTSGAIQLRWTARIQNEWIENLLGHRPDLKRESIERTARQMSVALPEAEISITETSSQVLPDPDDQHVLDAAISAGASVLLTFNLSDFPASALPQGLQAVHPDAFLQTCLNEQPELVLKALQELRADLKKPPFTPEELLAAMFRAEVPGFAAQLQPFKDSL